MSCNLQFIHERAPPHVALQRQRAIYLDAQSPERTVWKVRNLAELLARGYRACADAHTALLIDVKP
jgi:hypothetical protein